MKSTFEPAAAVALLSDLALGSHTLGVDDIAKAVGSSPQAQLGQLRDLAMSHHVIVRAFSRLREVITSHETGRAEWIEPAIATEKARINHALSFLTPICQALEEAGDVIVIKSLDHWPDLGSDLDLYTNASQSDIATIMRDRFHARLAQPSWGDRLANKCNFIVPELPELVEVHIGRLGQTGEQVALAHSVIKRSRTAQFGSHVFRIPSAEDRIVISTLQRMYRHFYLRLCDIVDMAHLLDSTVIDYAYLRRLTEPAGLWNGLCSYLVIVDEYVEPYRGDRLRLPSQVRDAARLGADNISFQKNFLRIPLFPQAASLYASEWRTLLLQGDFHNTLRLTMLPGLAVAAVLASKATGSDKGIW